MLLAAVREEKKEGKEGKEEKKMDRRKAKNQANNQYDSSSQNKVTVKGARFFLVKECGLYYVSWDHLVDLTTKQLEQFVQQFFLTAVIGRDMSFGEKLEMEKYIDALRKGAVFVLCHKTRTCHHWAMLTEGFEENEDLQFGTFQEFIKDQTAKHSIDGNTLLTWWMPDGTLVVKVSCGHTARVYKPEKGGKPKESNHVCFEITHYVEQLGNPDLSYKKRRNQMKNLQLAQGKMLSLDDVLALCKHLYQTGKMSQSCHALYENTIKHAVSVAKSRTYDLGSSNYPNKKVHSQCIKCMTSYFFYPMATPTGLKFFDDAPHLWNEESKESKLHVFTCTKESCGHSWCVSCQWAGYYDPTGYHDNDTCKDYRAMKDMSGKYKLDSETRAMLLKAGAKECPNCKVMVTKSDGCDLMTCLCKTHFCGVCGVTIKGHTYAHFVGQNVGGLPTCVKRKSNDLTNLEEKKDHDRPPVEDHYRPPVEDHYRPPVEDHYRPPVEDHNRPPVEDHVRPPVEDHIRPPIEDHVRRQVAEDVRQQVDEDAELAWRLQLFEM
jgi:hypothetical protein